MKKTYDPLSGNQALQLLWILEKEPEYNLELTKDELSYVRLCLMEGWNDLTSPYRKLLISSDKLEILSKLSNHLPIFI
jgi:hypothetical protein